MLQMKLLMNFADRQLAQLWKRKMQAFELHGSTGDTYRTSKRLLNLPSESPADTWFLYDNCD